MSFNRIFSWIGFGFFLMISGCACPDGKTYTYLTSERLAELKASFSNLSEEDFKDLLKLRELSHEFLPQQVILKFKSDTSARTVRDTLSTLSGSTKYRFKSSNALLIEIPSAPTKADVLAIVTALNEVKSIEYAVPNGINRLTVLPDDPQFVELDNLKNSGQQQGTIGADIRAEQAWQITTGSKDVLVGVIDTGIDYLHPDLVSNIWRNSGETGIDEDGFDKASNGVDDDGNGYVDDVMGWNFVKNNNDPMDDYGHGTHVAGTIGATGNNGIGITGVAWNVSLVALKVFNEEGGASDADIIRAIEYATTNRIPITNNSWGGFAFNQAMKDAIEANGKVGGLFIAAAGNEGTDNDQIKFFPASYGLDNIISVGAMTNKDEKARFSNFGSHSVQIGAPGENILSLGMSHTGQLYTRMSGTSMAAPHVAGAAALIRSAFPESSMQQIRDRILFGSDQLPQLLSMQWNYTFWRPDRFAVDKPLFQGGRRLNVASSLETDLEAPGVIGDLKIDFFGLTSINVSFLGSGDDGSSGKASGYLAAITPTPLLSDTQWNEAKKIELSYLEQDSSQKVLAEVVGLEPFQAGYLTVRALDNVGNLGPRTSSLHFQMSRPTVVYHNDAETDEGINFKHLTMHYQPFQREEVSGRGQVWSDSPGGPRPFASHYIEFPEVTITHPDTIFQFQTKLDCDLVYERGELEYLLNDQKDPHTTIHTVDPVTRKHISYPAPLWRVLTAYSASQCEWGQVNISLRNKVKAGDKIRVRFVFRGIGRISQERDGWMIDDVKFIAPGVPEVPTGLKAIKSDYSSPYRLIWTDRSEGETRFEIRRGETILGESEVNQAFYETGLQTLENDWQVRACNGSVCSAWSDPVEVLPAPPHLQSITPSSGPLQGGTLLRVFGLGFHPRVIIRIGGVDCTNINLLSSTELTCLTPAFPASLRTLVAVDQFNQKSYLVRAFTYQAPPTVDSVTPAIGNIAGGQWITIQGSNFRENAQVFLGSESCSSIVLQSSTQIRCFTPALGQGYHSIVVRNTDHQDSAAHLLVRYRVIPPVWIATNGGVCNQVCRNFQMKSVVSPEGASCTSGKVVPASARKGGVPYSFGCAPFKNCRAQGRVAGAKSVGKFCYGLGQKREKTKQDITVGCYCSP